MKVDREQRDTCHRTKSLLSSGIPQLQAHFQAIHDDFLRNKKGAGGRHGWTGGEFVLSEALNKGRLAYGWNWNWSLWDPEFVGFELNYRWGKQRCGEVEHWPELPITTTLASSPEAMLEYSERHTWTKGGRIFLWWYGKAMSSPKSMAYGG
jgi:hypothetical protein